MAKQRAERDLTRPLRIRRASLKPHNMPIETQLCCVLHGHGAFRWIDLIRENVEQGRLAGSGSAGHEQVHVAGHRRPQQRGAVGRNAPAIDQCIKIAHGSGETPYGHDRAVDRGRGNHSVQP
jgi:hypothetical protein